MCPNWCTNELIVTGDIADVALFKLRAEGPANIPYQRNVGLPGDPPPAELIEQTILSNYSLYPPPKRVLKAEYGKGGKNNGYDWEANHYGCKWGICNPQIQLEEEGKIIYTFETAWGPPNLMIQKIGKDFPTLEFTLTYAEPGMCFAGKLVVSEGNTIQNDEHQKGEEYRALYTYLLGDDGDADQIDDEEHEEDVEP